MFDTPIVRDAPSTLLWKKHLYSFLKLHTIIIHDVLTYIYYNLKPTIPKMGVNLKKIYSVLMTIKGFTIYSLIKKTILFPLRKAIS